MTAVAFDGRYGSAPTVPGERRRLRGDQTWRADRPEPPRAHYPGSMAEQAWTELPEPVRARLAEVASVAVAELPAAEVPAGLRRLTKFTPSKRARLGARALLGELRDSAAFRAAVLAWWEEHRP